MKIKLKLLTKKDFADLFSKICRILGLIDRRSVQSPTSDVGARRTVSNYLISFLFIFNILFCEQTRAYEMEQIKLCPMCTKEGAIICPFGFKPWCNSNAQEKPLCLYYGNKYLPGCFKFVGKTNLNFVFPESLIPGFTAKVTGGGDTFTLNTDTVSCKKQ